MFSGTGTENLDASVAERNLGQFYFAYWREWYQRLYRGAGKSLARSGRKQARKHVRDARNFNNIESLHRINVAYSSKSRGTRWRSWLRHCATSRKVAGSIPDYIIKIFLWHNPSDRTTALGFIQLLKEMSKS